MSSGHAVRGQTSTVTAVIRWRWSLFDLSLTTTMYPMLAKLPFHLLVTSLALAASALPVESVELKVLTPDNFQSTIAQGVWFIEHFSPYCHHCRQFAPTWEKLVQENEAAPGSGIHLAQVNCAVNGGACHVFTFIN